MSGRNALEALVGTMTVAELSHRSGRSVESIVGWAMKGNSGGNGVSGRKTSKSGGASRVATKAVNTRTKEGRAAYDESVLDTVRGSQSPIGATAIRQQVGGTPLQVRASLDRLIESGAVSYEGRARATRYFTS